MGVSGQHHASAALYPRGKSPQCALYRWLGGPQSRSGRRGWKKIPLPLSVLNGTPDIISSTSLNFCIKRHISCELRMNFSHWPPEFYDTFLLYLTTVSMFVFWVATPSPLAGTYQGFGGTCYFNLRAEARPEDRSTLCPGVSKIITEFAKTFYLTTVHPLTSWIIFKREKENGN
jgi:hypothetical protein